MTAIVHSVGDVYCPKCFSSRLVLDTTLSGSDWGCGACGWQATWEEWPYDPALADWVWPDGARPNPGCPWCGSCNIRGGEVVDGRCWWRCQRTACDRTWNGRWVLKRDGSMRWKIRLRARDVPHA